MMVDLVPASFVTILAAEVDSEIASHVDLLRATRPPTPAAR